MEKRILFTGGGSAGHVTVNLELIPLFQQEGWKVSYIGSKNGLEKELIGPLDGVDYYGVSTGKLRRYLDWNNLKDPFRVAVGVIQAYRLIKRIKPHVIFSKGGFVSVPVVIGGWLHRVPILIHESDLTPGLANRIAYPLAAKVLTTFPETRQHLRGKKAVYVGAVVRKQLHQGDADRGRSFCGFDRSKPVLLVMGGSLGSQRLNQALRRNLDALLATFQIVHICGKGQTDATVQKDGYRQLEYVQAELADILAMTDIVVSRAGSNAIFEFLSLQIPMLLVPLSVKASRGDQILNARSFQRNGYCDVLMEEELDSPAFLQAVMSLYDNRDRYRERMSQVEANDTTTRLVRLIKQAAGVGDLSG